MYVEALRLYEQQWTNLLAPLTKSSHKNRVTLHGLRCELFWLGDLGKYRLITELQNNSEQIFSVTTRDASHLAAILVGISVWSDRS